jgi:hypothetical protein
VLHIITKALNTFCSPVNEGASNFAPSISLVRQQHTEGMRLVVTFKFMTGQPQEVRYKKSMIVVEESSNEAGGDDETHDK